MKIGFLSVVCLLSVHTNCLAILTGLTDSSESKRIFKFIEQEKEITKPTLYWQFYVNEALKKAGLASDYLNYLGPWLEVLPYGVTTWPETGPVSRSECHGWGASPNYHLFTHKMGIESMEPGGKVMAINPNLSEGEKVTSKIPVRGGYLEIELESLQGVLKGKVIVPLNSCMQFFLNGKTLSAGENSFN